MNKLIFEDESYKIIGAILDVRFEMGSGFLEDV